jgi:hypothetical protein
MAVPLIPVVIIGARIAARFAASKAGKEAAKKFAKEFGGTVKEKAKNLKSVQKAPTGAQATRMMKQKLKKDGIKPTQKDRLGPASSPKKTPKKDVRGDKVQKGIAAVALTAASFAPGTETKKDSKPAGTYQRTGGVPIGGKPPKGKKEDRAKDSAVSPKPSPKKDGAKKPPKAPPKKGKDFRDFKTVAAAQAAGFDYFQGKDGKKKIAVTREQLERYKNKNKIKTNSEALRSYANMLRRK